MDLKKLRRFSEGYRKLKWAVWYWTLLIILPIVLLLFVYDGTRLLMNKVPPADREHVIENVAIRGTGALVLGPIWYFGMHRPRRRWKR